MKDPRPRVPAWRRYLRFWGNDSVLDLEDELRFHIDARIDEYIASGMSPDAARTEATARFGDVVRYRTECQEVDSRWTRHRTMLETIQTVVTDFRRAVRQLRRTPTLTAAALLCFALGIGANVSIFSVVNAVLFRPLPFRDPERLVLVGEQLPAFSAQNFGVISLGEYSDYRTLNGRTFESSAFYENRPRALAGQGEPERVTGVDASPELFDVLGAPITRGRGFVPRDTTSDGGNVVVISNALWQRRYHGDEGIIGRSIDVDGNPSTVIGVTPAEFQFPLGGQLGPPADVFVPIRLPVNVDAQRANAFNTFFVARLAAGQSRPAARRAVDAFAHSIAQHHPGAYGPNWVMAADLIPLRDRAVGDVRGPLLMLLGAVGLVLLIACINVSSLLIARAAGQHREIAMRRALGASRARLMQQFLAETIVLVATAGALGLALALWGARLLASHSPHTVLQHYVPSLDGRVLLAATGVLAVTSFIFSLVPAFSSSASALASTLRDDSRAATAGQSRLNGRRALVVVEMSLALTLAAVAGIMVRSFLHARNVQPGFDADHAVSVRVGLPPSRYPGARQIVDFQQRLVEAFQRIPHVTAAASTNDLPMGDDANRFALAVDGVTAAATPIVSGEIVSPGYFDAMRLPIVEGRALDESDQPGAALAVVINETAARTLFGGRPALGGRVKSGGPRAPTPWLTVVGIARDVREAGLDKPVEPQVYFPLLQADSGLVHGLLRTASYVVRTDADEQITMREMQRAIRAIDPDLPVVALRPLSDAVGLSLTGRTFNTVLLGAFALLAVLLAAVGIYGLLAYSVVQRTREIGIRLAIGATPSNVIALIIANGARLALVGVVIGLAGAAALARALRSLFFNVSALDPVSLGGAALFLLAIAVMASWLPAWRASRVDPQTAIRDA